MMPGTPSGPRRERGFTLLSALVGVLALLVAGVGAVLLVGRVEQSALQPLPAGESAASTEASFQRLLEQLARSARLERRGGEIRILLAPRAVQALRGAAAPFGTYELSVVVQTADGQPVADALVVADAVANYQRDLRLPASALEAVGGAVSAVRATVSVIFSLRAGGLAFAARDFMPIR